MGLAAALFPVKDGFVKAVSGSITPVEAALVYFFVQGLVALIWSFETEKYTRSLRALLTSLKPLFLVRTVFQVLAIILFFIAIQNAHLAEAVILFASNALFLVVLSWLVLKESMTLRKIMVTSLGFIGVLTVMSPHISGFGNVYLWYALASAFTFAIYLLATKALGQTYPPAQMLLVDGFLGTFLCIACLIAWTLLTNLEVTLIGASMRSIIFLVLSGIIGTASALLVIVAMKNAPASVVAPLGYIEIVSAALIGYAIFNETIGIATIIGCIIILGSSWLSGRLSGRLNDSQT
jgi:drug/metabolite transporter (DMT)-like permease